MPEGIEGLTGPQRQALALGERLLHKNPDIARRAKRLAREADPTLVLPELDLEDSIEKVRKENKDELDKRDRELMELRVNQRKAARDAEIADKGFTVEEIEKIIVDEKCSYETAMKIAALQRQTAEPTAGEVQGSRPMHTPIDVRPEADVRKLQGNALRRWSSETAHSMIDAFAKTRRAVAR